MVKKLKREDVHRMLAEAKAKNLPRPKIEDVFEVQGELPEDIRKVLDEYLHQFCWVEDNKCPCCDTDFVHSFEWGLTHGVGHCRYCSYPARYYHYDVGPFTKISVLLPYHPDGINPVEEKKRGRDSVQDGDK